jgi:hypothetical protein
MMTLKIRDICAVVALGFVLSLTAAAQTDSSKPKVSSDPLPAEQIAVYRAVLEDYTKGAGGNLNLANKTELLERPGSDDACVKGLDLEAPQSSAWVVHQFATTEALGPKVVVVDPDQQDKQVKDNDPQKLIKSAIDDHEKVTDKQLDDSIKRAFETGLFTLSEVVFDKQHRHAVVAYSFVCGGLCGHGNTVVLKKVGQKWKVVNRCGGGWVS